MLLRPLQNVTISLEAENCGLETPMLHLATAATTAPAAAAAAPDSCDLLLLLLYYYYDDDYDDDHHHHHHRDDLVTTTAAPPLACNAMIRQAFAGDKNRNSRFRGLGFRAEGHLTVWGLG